MLPLLSRPARLPEVALLTFVANALVSMNPANTSNLYVGDCAVPVFTMTMLVPAGYSLPAPSMKSEVVVNVSRTLYTFPTLAAISSAEPISSLSNEPEGLYTLDTACSMAVVTSDVVAKTDRSRVSEECVPFAPCVVNVTVFPLIELSMYELLSNSEVVPR